MSVVGLMAEGLRCCRLAAKHGEWILPTDNDLMHDRSVLAVDWCLNGFPALELGHKLAAAFMCTDPPEAVRMPWSTFLVHVPSGLLGSKLTHFLVRRRDGDDDSFSLFLCYDDREASLSCDTLARLASDLPISVEELDDKQRPDASKRLARTLACVTRLFANACAAMEQPSHVQRVGKGCALAPFEEGRRPAVEPKAQLFRLGAPVRVDCREAVRAFALGARRSAPKVQWIVRGHWTHQAHGPAHALRRLQWVEPYWKGREGAPINVRSHVLGAE